MNTKIIKLSILTAYLTAISSYSNDVSLCKFASHKMKVQDSTICDIISKNPEVKNSWETAKKSNAISPMGNAFTVCGGALIFLGIFQSVAYSTGCTANSMLGKSCGSNPAIPMFIGGGTLFGAAIGITVNTDINIGNAKRITVKFLK